MNNYCLLSFELRLLTHRAPHRDEAEKKNIFHSFLYMFGEHELDKIFETPVALFFFD